MRASWRDGGGNPNEGDPFYSNLDGAACQQTFESVCDCPDGGVEAPTAQASRSLNIEMLASDAVPEIGGVATARTGEADYETVRLGVELWLRQ